jgi:26S proteasome regulatory subunit N12
MAANISSVLQDAFFVSSLQTLREQFSSSQYEKAADVMAKVRTYLITKGILFSDNPLPTEALVLVRDILEMGAYIALFQKDIEGFAKCISYLKAGYYGMIKGAEYTNSIPIPQSERMYPLIGLELLRYLVQHKLVEFHTLLEYLSPEVLMNNPYIRGSIVLEQCMMEGSFQKALEACTNDNLLGPEYQYFMECMIGSLRDELADCFEMAYVSLGKMEAMKLLFCKQEKDLLDLSKKRNWEWDTKTDLIHFPKHTRSTTVVEKQANLDLVLERDLLIARQVEKII